MKLRTRLMIFFILIILITVLSFGFFTLTSFSDIFEEYLINEQEDRLEQIIADISLILQRNQLDISNEELLIYARNEHVNLIIKDDQGQLVASYYGMSNIESPTITQSEYSLVNPMLEEIGTLTITYDLENPFLSNAVQLFQRRSIQSSLFILIIIVLISSVLSYYLSRNLTHPISQLSQTTNRIREKDYDIKPMQSGIMEIDELSQNMTFLAKSLEIQEKTRSEYAQDISHELRTPLTNLQLHLEAIDDGVLEADKKTIETLLNNTDQLKEIVVRLKETFEDSSMLSDPVFERTNLSEELNEILDSFEPNMKKKNIVLTRAIDEDIYYTTDQRMFRQIVTNFVSNAIKAIYKEENGRIRVSLNYVGNQISLSVRDNGVGMSEEDQSRIFERFYRVDEARNSQQGGTGLGLSITKNIASLLGAQIQLRSKLGEGSNFTVYFPLYHDPKRNAENRIFDLRHANRGE